MLDHLSKPFTFGHPGGFGCGFADVAATCRWDPHAIFFLLTCCWRPTGEGEAGRGRSRRRCLGPRRRKEDGAAAGRGGRGAGQWRSRRSCSRTSPGPAPTPWQLGMAAELAPPNGEEGAVARIGRRGARRSSSRPEEEDGTCAPTVAAAATRRLDRAHACHRRTAFDRVLAEDSPAPGADVVIPMADRKSTRLNSSHYALSRMPSSA